MVNNDPAPVEAPKDELEKLAEFYDGTLTQLIENMREALDRFAERRSYPRFLRMETCFRYIDRAVDARGILKAHSVSAEKAGRRLSDYKDDA